MKNNIEIILLGEGKVGKTQIVNQLINKNFNEKYIKTYSPKEEKKIIKIIEDEIVKSKNLSIYDLPGIKNFRSINNTFLKSSKIILLIYDITNIESFIELYNWNELINGRKNILKCVIGNKNDLLEKRVISFEDGRKFAEEIRASFFETNARDYINIYELFAKIVTEYSQFYEKKEYCQIYEKKDNAIHLKKEKTEKKEDNCCPSISEKEINEIDQFIFEPFLYSTEYINEENIKDDEKKIKRISIEFKNGTIIEKNDINNYTTIKF